MSKIHRATTRTFDGTRRYARVFETRHGLVTVYVVPDGQVKRGRKLCAELPDGKTIRGFKALEGDAEGCCWKRTNFSNDELVSRFTIGTTARQKYNGVTSGSIEKDVLDGIEARNVIDAIFLFAEAQKRVSENLKRRAEESLTASKCLLLEAQHLLAKWEA